MKTKLGVLVILLAATFAPAQTNNLTALLQQGLFEEQANRNLDAAIADYQALARQFDKDRQLAATAVFRLGECYRMQGKTNEAALEYQRILRDFSDQTTLATLSRQNLAGMGALTTASASASEIKAASASATLSDLEKEFVTQKSQLELARGETNLLLVARLFGDTNLAKLVETLRMSEEGLASEKLNTSSTNIPAWERSVGVKKYYVEKAKKDLLDYQEFRLRSLASAVTQARGLSATNMLTSSTSTMTLDVEETEIQRIQTMIQNSPDLINAASEGVNGNLTPLGNAAAHGWLKVVAFLLDHGADVNGGYGSAIFSATKAGNRAMVELLLSRGANVNANQQDTSKSTPLHIAAQNGFQAVVEVLLANKADVNAQNSSGNAPLLLAAQRNNPKILSLLLEHKPDVNAQSLNGFTPLIAAVAAGELENVNLLLAAGANPNTVDNSGRTPLSYAAETDSPQAGRRSGFGGRGGFGGGNGTPPLNYSAGRGSPQMVKQLLAAKADPNGGTSDAPLLCAIYTKDAASAEMLLQAGANPNSTGEFEVSPGGMLWRRPGGQVGGISGGGGMGGGFGRQSVTPLWLAVSEQQLPMVQLLLKYKADPNGLQNDGRPLLFSALSDTNILEALLDAGAKVDARDPITKTGNDRILNWTPLLLAVANNYPATTVEILLKHSANPNARDGAFGLTPLHWFGRWGDNHLPNQTVLELLLAYKADPNVRNDGGETPLSGLVQRMAASGLTPDQKATLGECADLLRRHGALDNLPDWDRITVSRPSANFSAMVFQRNTNNWNHFTLLELLYRMRDYGSRAAFNFPDLSRIVVVRPSANGAEFKRIPVSLLNAANELDASRDVPLEFGDVVEIPEREHSLAEPQEFLNLHQQTAILDHFRNAPGEAKLVVAGGQTVQLPLQPFYSQIGQMLTGNKARTALTSSSDLSRVKVTRLDPKMGKMESWTLDCRKLDTGGDTSELWLREGDVIEVPLKP